MVLSRNCFEFALDGIGNLRRLNAHPDTRLWTESGRLLVTAGGIEIEAGGDVSKATDLADLERRVTPFVDTLWPSSGSNP